MTQETGAYTRFKQTAEHIAASQPLLLLDEPTTTPEVLGSTELPANAQQLQQLQTPLPESERLLGEPEDVVAEWTELRRRAQSATRDIGSISLRAQNRRRIDGNKNARRAARNHRNK